MLPWLQTTFYAGRNGRSATGIVLILLFPSAVTGGGAPLESGFFPVDKQPEISLITLSTCYFCSLLEKWLDEKGFVYTWTDIDLLPDEERRNRMEEIRKFNPEETFPVVIIGNKAIVGFQEERIKMELGLL